MTNDERSANAQMTKSFEHESSSFGFRHSFVIRHSSFHRQQYPNGRAPPDFALGFDVAAVELRDMFHNRKAKACASNAVMAARLVDAVESLENAR
jgi:hypothetical protein